MQILEHGQAQERTLLFFPCTAEPVWAFADTITLLSQRWHVFQVVYDGHQPEYPGDFTSVEQTVDEVISYLKSHGVSRLGGAYGCSMGGACLTRLLALGECPSTGPSSTAGSRPISCSTRCESYCFGGILCPLKWRRTAEKFWKRPFRRNGLPPQGTTPKRSTTPWKPISKPFPIGRSAMYSGLPTTMRFRSAPLKSVRKSPTGTATTKRRIAGEISGSSSAIFLRRASMASPRWPMRSW